MMKTRRFLFLLGALLGLPACPDPNPCFGSGSPPSGSSTEVNVIVVGEKVSMRISPDNALSCDTDVAPPTPLSFSVELSDPDNQPVDNVATLGKPSTSSAGLQFTPDKQGRYHVFAAFDPVGGIQQFELYAARDRSAEAPLQTLSQSCNALERTRRGGWLCDSDFVRDGTVMNRFTNARLAASGDVVWAVSPTQILRLVDTGTALEPSATLANTQGAAKFLLASADELVILHGSTLQRITFDGTQLATTGVTIWEAGTAPIGPPALQAVLLRTGDQLAIVAGSTTNFGSTTVLKVCPYELKAGRFVSTGASCQLLASEVVGFEPTALWTGTRFSISDIFNDVHRLVWTGTALVDQGSLPLGLSFRTTTRSSELRNTATPVIIPSLSAVNPRPRATVPVYSTERRGILLEILDADIPEPAASPTLLWGAPTTSTGQLRIRTRPSTP